MRLAKLPVKLNARRIYLSVLGIAIVFAIVFLILSNFIFFKVSFGGKRYFLLNNTQLDQLAHSRIENFKQSRITLLIDGEKLNVLPDELGIIFSKDQISDSKLGTGKSLFVNLANNFAVFDNGFKPSFTIDLDKFLKQSDAIFLEKEKQAENAKIEYVDGNFRIKAESSGMVVDRVDFISKLKERVTNFSNEPIEIVKYEQKARFSKEQYGSALEKIKVLQTQNLSLVYNFDRWTLSPDLLELVVFAPRGRQNDYLSKIDIGQHETYVNLIYLDSVPLEQIDLALDPLKIKSYLGNIARNIDRPSVDATLKFENGRVTEFTQARDGQTLNIDLTRSLISEKISTDYSSSNKSIVITLPVSVKKAKIANDEINNLGVRELVASGVSYFAGSIPNRVYNVGLGAKRLNGFLVKPDEEFSFNEAVGEVSAKTGYREAYVISSGKTVLDDGGGICQVSTTVFRAALNGGFPITARTAHAYRVGYYEQGGFKAGFDATVWQPSVDLKFKNDTGHHILVQATVDTARAKLLVDIYGTRDDRKVEISGPVISNVKSAPEDKYQDDPTLPKGTVKQVDFAAVGATSVFSRKVYKGGQLAIDEKFVSNFRPWQAVFLVGTGG